jgi:hypothetical protein
MAPRLILQPMPVLTGCDDQEGYLVLADGQLVAVLVRLADEMHADQLGSWFLEAGFGPCRTTMPPVFDDLDEAQAWVRRQLIG